MIILKYGAEEEVTNQLSDHSDIKELMLPNVRLDCTLNTTLGAIKV